MREFDTGYSVTIGKPVVHAEKKAAGESVSFPCEAIPDGSYLVSLEVNGSVKAYRESLEFSSGSCTVGEYTLSYSSYALTVSGTSNNDIVRVMVEPLEVKTTDAFRAAVKKDAPETPDELPAVAAADKGKFLHTNESTGALEWANGGSGGGVLVVTFTNPNNFPKKADYTFEEIKSAYDNGSALLAKSDTSGSMLGQLAYSEAQPGGTLAYFSGLVMRAAATRIFIDEVKISSDNSVTSTQKKTVEYDA